jgi:hypothetical protein
MKEVHHVAEVDYTCQRCKTFVHARIPHECDPSICPVCNGNKQAWAVGVGWDKCDRCGGTGRLDLRK